MFGLAILAMAAPTPPAPVTHAALDVPQDKGAQQVLVQTREFPRGTTSGWHIHHGVEVACMTSGETRFSVRGEPPRNVRAGECVTIPREVPHTAMGIGRSSAKLVITLMADKGAPLREAVAPPE